MKINYNDKNIKTLGRTLEENSALHFCQSYSGVEFSVRASRVSVTLCTNSPDMEEKNKAYIGVITDGDEKTFKKMPVFEKEGEYVIFQSDEPQTHTFTVIKISENFMAYVALKAITANTNNGLMQKPAKKPLSIQLVGDSITCGYGIESMDGAEKFTTEKENVYFTYAAQAARRLNGEISFVSRSGIGIFSSYTEADQPNTELLMGEYYLSADKYLETVTGKSYPADFSDNVDIITVFLGTNDHTWTKEIPEREEQFKQAYIDFIRLLRDKNKNAEIICCYGSFEKSLTPYISSAVEKLNGQGDKKVHFCEFSMHLKTDGYGCDGHPSIVSHNRMAEELYQKIKMLAF